MTEIVWPEFVLEYGPEVDKKNDSFLLTNFAGTSFTKGVQPAITAASNINHMQPDKNILNLTV